MEIKLIKPVTLPDKEELFKERLSSNNAMFKSLIFIRTQDNKDVFNKRQGDLNPFLLDSHYI